MGMHRFIVGNGFQKVPGTYFWEYIQTEKGLVFNNTSSMQQISVDGDYLGKEVVFNADGRKSAFLGVVTPPADQRRKILWDNKFTSITRVMDNEFNNPLIPGAKWNWAELVARKCGWDGISDAFDGDVNVKKTTIYDENGNLMVATAIGVLENGQAVKWSYLNPAATVGQCVLWEEKYKS